MLAQVLDNIPNNVAMNCLSNMLWYISVRTCNNEGECHDRIEHLFDTIGRFAPYEYSGRMKTIDFKIPFVHPLTKLVDVQACLQAVPVSRGSP